MLNMTPDEFRAVFKADPFDRLRNHAAAVADYRTYRSVRRQLARVGRHGRRGSRAVTAQAAYDTAIARGVTYFDGFPSAYLLGGAS